MNVPARVGVLGGGRMGGGIAHAFLLAGADVVVVDQPEFLARAGDGIRTAVDRSVERGSTALTRDALVAALTVTADRDALSAKLTDWIAPHQCGVRLIRTMSPTRQSR